jgi:phosphoglycolate phosphatase-like HAD superfamily hydrolase
VLKAVIFDIDGTLIDSVDLHAQSWVVAFASFGVDVRFEEVRRHIGEGADRLIPSFVPTSMPNDKIKKIEEFRSDLFKREYLRKVKRFPKVPELFACIRSAGCKLVLGSSCTSEEIGEYKAIAGITDMTDHDVTADDAGSSKPSPHIFLKALECLAPVIPSQTCVVGETKYDGEAAGQAGIPFIGVLCGGSSQHELEQSGAVAIFRDPANLLTDWSCWRDLRDIRQSSNP